MIRLAGASYTKYEWGPQAHPDVGDTGNQVYTITHNLNSMSLIGDFSFSATSSPTATRNRFNDVIDSAGYALSRGFKLITTNPNEATLIAYRMSASTTYLWVTLYKLP